ncbi:MAG TPA: hypothetical protein PKL49_02570 [Steroidobacteraceae bacterium]|nr:hypothetical protein [Steroidobacteraceae bacterium]HNS26599.1 hypothetical protein [Steroidobacteraceae bacterium]
MDLTTEQIIELWFHYEEVAMHFNELIIQYRLQLMGGVGAIGALSAYLIGDKVEDRQRRYRLRLVASLGLFVLVLAAALLDLLYYNKLLLASVDVLIDFEKAHPPLNMSTRIAEKIAGQGLPVICGAYGVVLGSLGLFTLWSWRQHSKCTERSLGDPTDTSCVG